MKVLQIGGDKTLLSSGDSPSNTRDRMNLLSQHLKRLVIAVLTEKNDIKRHIGLSDNLDIYSIPCKGKNPLTTIYWGYKMCSEICSSNSIDVISVQDPFIMGFIGYLLNLKYKIPLNIQIHGDFIDNPWWIKQSKTHILWNRWAKWVLKRADLIRTVNPSIKSHLIQQGISEKKIMDFPVFLGLKNLKKDAADLKDQFSDYENIFLFAGFLIPRKSVDTILKAMPPILEKYPHTLLLVAGDGPEKEKLEEISKNLKIIGNVFFAGNVPHDQMGNYYKTCDLLILPSLSESWGRVVLEAMSFQKPVIVSDACRIAGMVKETSSGLTFKADDPSSLAQKLIYVLENPEISHEMGFHGRQLVYKDYSDSILISRYIEMWEKTISEATS